MSFRLTNALTTFCNLMNDVLFYYLNSFIIVYLNDIVIYNQTLQEQFHYLRYYNGLGNTNCMSRRESVSLLRPK